MKEVWSGEQALKEKENTWRAVDNDPDFLRFLMFCVERLEQRQEVQEIWAAWNGQKNAAANQL